MNRQCIELQTEIKPTKRKSNRRIYMIIVQSDQLNDYLELAKKYLVICININYKMNVKN